MEQTIQIKRNLTDATAVPSSLKGGELAVNAKDRALFVGDGSSVVKLYTGDSKYFDSEGAANKAVSAVDEGFKIGNLYLKYDSTNNAIYVEGGNFYAEQEVSAFGYGGIVDDDDSGSSNIDTTYLVTTNTVQTISASKTFTSTIKYTPSFYTYNAEDIEYRTTSGTLFGGIGAVHNGNTVSYFYMGTGSTPWNGSTGLVVGEELGFNGHQVWHSGNIQPITKHQDLSNYVKLTGALKNPYTLTWSGYSSGSYDGSAAASITIPTLDGYVNTITTTGSGNAITAVSKSGSTITFTKGTTFLTAHQAIYNLTLQAGSFTAVTFDPNGADKTVNIPTTTSHISEGSNLYFTNARVTALLKSLTLTNSEGTTVLTYNPSTVNSLKLTKAIVGLSNVENTALSTWAGSGNIKTVGTITSGTWNGSAIANAFLANSSISISGTSVSLGGSITQATLRSALGLGSNAYTSTAYLPLSGGTMATSSGIFNASDTNTEYAAIGFNLNHNAFGSPNFPTYIRSNVNPILTLGTTNYTIYHTGNLSPLTTSNYTSYTYSQSTIESKLSGYQPLSTAINTGNISSQSVAYATSAGNTDTLDGCHLHSLMYLTDKNAFDDTKGLVVIPISEATSSPVATGTRYGAVLQWASTVAQSPSASVNINWYYQIWGDTALDNLYWRKRTNGDSWTTPRALACTDDNVASATKLQTARTIWGQSFDGTGNVSGSLTSTGHITSSTNNTYNIGSQTNIYSNVYTGNLFLGNSGLYLRSDGVVSSHTNGTLDANLLKIDSSSGNVGIATTSPKSKLSVYIPSLSSNPTSGNLGTSSTMEVGCAGLYGTYFWTRGTGNGYIQQGRTDGTATSYHLILQVLGGNVGIGTESPTYKLHVAGTMHVSSTVTFASTLSVTNTIYSATGIYTAGYVTAQKSASDMRLKTVLDSNYDALSMLNNLSTFTYKWNDTARNVTNSSLTDNYVHYGLSAQELQNISETFIDAPKIDDKYLILNKAELVPVLVQAIKQLSQELKELKAKLK